MADVNYTVGVDTSNAQRNLQNLQNKVGTLTNSFNQLQGAIAGLAIGAAISNAIGYADAIQDLSDATGLAIANIMGFSSAVTLNGGNAETANKAILKLVQTIGEAASGSQKAQDAFDEVGVTLEDLKYLSEQDLLRKTVQGLAKIDDAGKRLRLTVELLGKGFRGVGIQGLNSQLDKATLNQAKYADAVAAAAAAQNSLDIATGNLKKGILLAIQPLTDFIGKLDPEQIKLFTDAVIKIGGSIGAIAAGITVIQKLGQAFVYVGGLAAGAFALWKVGLTTIAVSVASIGKTFGIAFNYIKNFFRMTPMFAQAASTGGPIAAFLLLINRLVGRIGFLQAGLAGLAIGFSRLLPLIGLVSAAIYLLNNAVEVLTGKDLKGWFDQAAMSLEQLVSDKFPRLADAMNRIGQALGMAGSPTLAAQANKRLLDAIEADKQEVIARRKAREEAEKQKQALRDVEDAANKQVKAIRNLSNAFRDQNNLVIQNLQAETQLLGKSEYFIEVERARNEVIRRAAEEVKKLTDAKINYMNTAEKINPKILAAYDAEIRKVQDLVKIDKERIAREMASYQARKMEIDAFNQKLEEVTRLEEMATRQGEELTGVYKSIIRPVQDTNKVLQERYEFEKALRGLGEYQIETAKELLSIEEQQIAAIREIERNSNLTAAAQTELISQVNDAYNKQIEMTRAMRDEQFQYQRQFSTGWKTAFNEYVDTVGSAANRAKNHFATFTSFFDNAIDQLVENGKIAWGDLVNSLIKELLKQELKSALANVAGALRGGGGGGGGLLGMGGFLGFLADGGPAIAGKPYIVGERGPELFVPKSSGTVVPNGASMGTSQNVTNNVYNISAVDAQSVARLFANNRRTLLGSIEQARKELPSRGPMRG